MRTEHIETLIIGAGQAGLASGYHLQQRGRPFLIVDANQRVGDGWRSQWESLKLYSPAKYDGLPGMRFPAEPWSFPGKDEVADYLEAYATKFGLPIRHDTRVDRLEASETGYVAHCGDVCIEADNVVVATGTFGRTPFVPDYADRIDAGTVQLHSSEYRRPSQLPPGPVLVVGASHSGCDIAYEAAETHPTILCGRGHGQIPVTLSSPMFRVLFPAMLFVFNHVLTRRTPMGRKEMDEFRFHGGIALRVQSADLARRGVERLTERVVDVRDGCPVLEDGRMVEASSVVWATGFRQAFDWIDLPVFDANGWPQEMRGVVDASPGLYFTGLGFQYSASSMLIAGAGRDAGHVVRHLVGHRPARSEALSAAG